MIDEIFCIIKHGKGIQVIPFFPYSNTELEDKTWKVITPLYRTSLA